MISSITDKLIKINSFGVLIFLAVVFVLMVCVIIPEAVYSVESIGNHVRIPEKNFFYTPEELYAQIRQLGKLGREYYVFFLLSSDLIFPITYTLFLSTLIIYLLNRFKYALEKGPIAMPFILGSFDLLENLGLTILIFKYPVEHILLARLVAMFTMFKWLFAIIVGLTVLIILARRVIAFLKS